jgi:ATP-GRASP peptide maturase of grasp-with-spasm system
VIKLKILTTKHDKSTDDIIDWLKYYQKDIVVERINEKEDLLANKNVLNTNPIYIRKYRHLLSQVDNNKTECFETKDDLSKYLKRLSNDELKIIIEYYFSSGNRQIIGNKEPFAENKLNQLEKAQKVGLNTPKTLITSQKHELVAFVNELKSDVIVKPLYNAIFFDYKKILFGSYTKKINVKIIQKLPNTFFTALFQEEIQKELEIRTFFFYGEFYSMCIFSQQNNQTSVDFRMYSNENPNREVPYKLLKEDKIKIIHLMNELNLNTGSIDFIKGVDGETYFLEVNPEGQFNMVSSPCNYNIEEKVSKKILETIEEA